MLLIGFGACIPSCHCCIPSGDILTLLFGMFLLMFGYMFIRSRLGSGDEGRIPKVLVKHELDDRPPFVDATATLSGSLLGDVRHDPFQSGGMETPAHDRVEPGAIHRANKGVLYIDEINLLRLEEQQALLTAMQERAFPSRDVPNAHRGLTKTEPVPCDFILIVLETSMQSWYAPCSTQPYSWLWIRSLSIQKCPIPTAIVSVDTFIAQEVRRDIGSTREIPHFDKSGVSLILREAQRRAGRRGKLSLRLRELGGACSNCWRFGG